MFDPDSINRHKKENDDVKRDGKEEEKLISTQSSNDDSNNRSKKVSTTTTNNDNQNYPSAKRLKQMDDSNMHRSEEKTDNIISDEELNHSIIEQYLQNLYFYDNKYERIVKFNLLFKFDEDTPKKLAVQYNPSINMLRKSILTSLYSSYVNDQWNLITLKKISTLLDNSIDHHLQAELLLILHISKFKIENVTKIQEIIEHVIPIQSTGQELILNELGLNLNIIREFKTVLLSNQIVRITEAIYFTLTKKQIDKNDLKQIINDIHIEFVRPRRAYQLRGFIQYKYDNPCPTLALLQLDSLTVVFHESMHTILRDKENNYNLSTPIDYAEANVEESGACIEKYIFKCCPNWVEIYKNNIISLPEIGSVLNAFKTDQTLSSLLPQGLDFFVRNVSTIALDTTSIDFGKSWEVQENNQIDFSNSFVICNVSNKNLK